MHRKLNFAAKFRVLSLTLIVYINKDITHNIN